MIVGGSGMLLSMVAFAPDITIPASRRSSSVVIGGKRDRLSQ
jgi:hypothetical protein